MEVIRREVVVKQFVVTEYKDRVILSSNHLDMCLSLVNEMIDEWLLLHRNVVINVYGVEVCVIGLYLRDGDEGKLELIMRYTGDPLLNGYHLMICTSNCTAELWSDTVMRGPKRITLQGRAFRGIGTYLHPWFVAA